MTLLFSVPIKVEIDEVNQKVYWSETNFFVSDVIRRANLDGTNIEDVITPLPTDPLATFVVDGAGGRIYFARGSQVSADIVSANLDGTAEVVLATGVADVGDLALDLVDGKIYWHEEVSATTKRIVRSNLDGSSPEVVIPAISNPAGELEVLPGGGKIYWADRDTTSPSILRANNDGTGQVDLIATSPANSVYGFGLNILPGAEINVQGNSLIIDSGDASPSATDFTDFSSVDVNTGFASQTFTIHNCGDQPLTVGDIVFSGANPLDFSVSVPPASTVAAEIGTSTFTVIFDPAVPGASNAVINIVNSDADENPYSFAVTGIGTGAGGSEIHVSGAGSPIFSGDVTPNAIDGTDFGSILVGASAASSFQIDSLGTTDLVLTSPVVIIGADASEFTVTAQPNSTVSSILPEIFSVAFTPTSPGVKIAAVEIASDDGNENPFQFLITGIATACLLYTSDAADE